MALANQISSTRANVEKRFVKKSVVLFSNWFQWFLSSNCSVPKNLEVPMWTKVAANVCWSLFHLSKTAVSGNSATLGTHHHRQSTTTTPTSGLQAWSWRMLKSQPGTLKKTTNQRCYVFLFGKSLYIWQDGRWWKMMEDDGRWWKMTEDDGRWWNKSGTLISRGHLSQKAKL